MVKYEDITLMETIGEGMHCDQTFINIKICLLLSGEFGIVYKGKIGSRGRSSREVAVKTLKGLSSTSGNKTQSAAVANMPLTTHPFS